MDRHSPSDYGRERRPQERSQVEQGREPVAPALPMPALAPPKLDPMQERELLRQRSTPRQFSTSNRRELQPPEVKPSAGKERELNKDSQMRQPDRPRSARRANRASLPIREIGLELRPEERTLIEETGKFRVIALRDAAEFIYSGSEQRLSYDIDYLARQGLVEVHKLNTRRDGQRRDTERFEALTITECARESLQTSGELPPDQRVYAGLVKPREAEHDAQIFRAYKKEVADIERNGGRNVRVRLDFELKAQINRSVYQTRKAEPDRDQEDIKRAVAEQMGLDVREGHVVVPDLRIEYDLPAGGSTHVDVEVATAAYRHAQIAGKARAGMHIYASRGDIGRLGGAIQDDHDIMSEILSL